MIVIGHSGTEHFFPQSKEPPSTYIKPFIDFCNIEFAQWVELEISETELKTTVWNSGKATKADEFTIVKGTSSPNDPSNGRHGGNDPTEKGQGKEFEFNLAAKILVSVLIILIVAGSIYFIMRNDSGKTHTHVALTGKKLKPLRILSYDSENSLDQYSSQE